MVLNWFYKVFYKYEFQLIATAQEMNMNESEMIGARWRAALKSIQFSSNRKCAISNLPFRKESFASNTSRE